MPKKPTNIYMTLAETCRYLPQIYGKTLSPSTIWRWCRKGVRGVYLEYIRLGNSILVSPDAIQRFTENLASKDASNPPPTPVIKTSTQKHRQADIDHARKTLNRERLLDNAK
ncbi:MAG: hypothetical protein COA73_13220 [Candidatus Hydrogenedentota bacterium]|nr:MAG: hypothetical protein COA73_13220 [Candidatus Hydrogenedentota bacterium]